MSTPTIHDDMAELCDLLHTIRERGTPCHARNPDAVKALDLAARSAMGGHTAILGPWPRETLATSVDAIMARIQAHGSTNQHVETLIGLWRTLRPSVFSREIGALRSALASELAR